METKLQISIESLPSLVWRRILYSHHDANFIVNGGRGYKAMLKPFFRCKIASKKLNLLLNDQFFFETLQGSAWRKYRRAFLTKRIESLIIGADLVQFQNFYNMAIKYCLRYAVHARLTEILPLIVQKTNLNYLTGFVTHTTLKIFSGGILRGIKSACDRGHIDIIKYLLRLYPAMVTLKLHPTLTERLNLRYLIWIHNALEPCKNLASDVFPRLVHLFSVDFKGSELDEQINRLFSDDSKETRQKAVIVPEGELLHLERISQSRAFHRKYTNFCVKNKKRKSRVIVVPRT
jgi:hypothetical protein